MRMPLGDIRTAFRVMCAYGRIDEAAASAVAKAMCGAVARGKYGLRLIPTTITGPRVFKTDPAMPLT